MKWGFLSLGNFWVNLGRTEEIYLYFSRYGVQCPREQARGEVAQTIQQLEQVRQDRQ